MTEQKPMRFIRRKEVCYLTGISPSAVYLLLQQGKFPPSIRLPGGKAVAWLLSDIEEWQLKCIADSKAEVLQSPPTEG